MNQRRPVVRRHRSGAFLACVVAIGGLVAAPLQAGGNANGVGAGRVGAGSRSGRAAQPSGSVQPNGPLDAEVMVLHGTNQPNGGTGIDPRIGPLPALKQPPFSSYNSYQLISRNRIPLTKLAPATSTLPNGRVLQITLREVLAANRYRVATSINQPGGTTFLPLLEVTTPAGEPFFVAGQNYNGGMLVIGITVLK
jgi:hypothetical protein